MPDEQPQVTKQAPPLTTKEVIHQLRNLGGSNLTKLYKQESYEAIKETLKDVMDVHPNPDAIQQFLPQLDLHLKSLREQKKAYGGKVQKFATGGVTDRGQPAITETEKQAGVAADPVMPTGSAISFQGITPTADETLATTLAPTTAPSVTGGATQTAQTVSAPTTTAVGTAAEVPITGAGAQTLSEITGQTGTLSTETQITAPQGDVSSDSQVAAQSGSAAQAVAATRSLSASDLATMKETGELATASQLSDLGVSAAQVTAETSEVDSLATVQGQLQKLSTEFADENIPSFMAGAVRAANAAVNARGLGRSSIAAQAIYQAALESSVAIATQDAAVHARFSELNLTNKQQAAVVNAEIRARIQGQELTNAQQAAVVNAARIAEANNMNLTNQQQVALENSRLTQSMNLQNLNNKQQTALQNAATFAAMDTRNLDSRVQAAQTNAKSFLQQDLANLTNLQQAQVVNHQAKMQRLFNYEAAENARAQFNAKNTQQNDQFFAELGSQVARNNATRIDSMNEFNVSQQNAIGKINAEMENARDEFNATQQTIINQSNTQWRRAITTTNNAGVNSANLQNSMNLLGVSQNALNNLWQRYRDEASWVMSATENALSRAHSSAVAAMNNDFQKEMYEEQFKDSAMVSLGDWALGTISERFLGMEK